MYTAFVVRFSGPTDARVFSAVCEYSVYKQAWTGRMTQRRAPHKQNRIEPRWPERVVKIDRIDPVVRGTDIENETTKLSPRLRDGSRPQVPSRGGGGRAYCSPSFLSPVGERKNGNGLAGHG